MKLKNIEEVKTILKNLDDVSSLLVFLNQSDRLEFQNASNQRFFISEVSKGYIYKVIRDNVEKTLIDLI